MYSETLEEMVARINKNSFVPPQPKGVCTVAKAVKLAKGKSFEFTAGSGGSTTKYPWDQWFNGDLLMLERSEGPENAKGTIDVPTVAKDYGVPTDAMLPKIKTAARNRYKVCEISRKDADGHRLKDALIIRGRDMTPSERIAEDEHRAEEKATAKAVKEIEDRVAAESKAAGMTDAETAAAVKAAVKAYRDSTAGAAVKAAVMPA